MIFSHGGVCANKMNHACKDQTCEVSCVVVRYLNDKAINICIGMCIKLWLVHVRWSLARLQSDSEELVATWSMTGITPTTSSVAQHTTWFCATMQVMVWVKERKKHALHRKIAHKKVHVNWKYSATFASQALLVRQCQLVAYARTFV